MSDATEVTGELIFPTPEPILNRIAEIGVLIASMTEESRSLRKSVLEMCERKFGDTQPYRVLIGDRMWTVERSKDGKDVNITYVDPSSEPARKESKEC